MTKREERVYLIKANLLHPYQSSGLTRGPYTVWGSALPNYLMDPALGAGLSVAEVENDGVDRGWSNLLHKTI